MPDARRGERGQAAPLLLVALVLSATVCLGVAHIGDATGRRAAARAAADAAALAGAAQGPAAASALAGANDAVVIRYHAEADDVVVVVRRSGVEATARARRVPIPIP